MSIHTSPAAASGAYTLGGDMHIFRMGFGAMRITGKGVWGMPADKGEAIKVLRTAIDLGINFIDTADSYGPYVSEELIAEALYPYPDGLVIGTKGGLERPGPDKWTINCRPEHLEATLKGSLRRLRLDRIDLYQLHRFDTRVPADEYLGKLQELQQQGYVRHLGLSEVGIEQIKQARQYFEVVSIQNKYSLFDRKWQSTLEWTAQEGIGFIPWYPLDAGALQSAVLQNLARRHEASIYQIALAGLLALSPNMIPIPGTSSSAHLIENVAAASIQLSEKEVEMLREMD